DQPAFGKLENGLVAAAKCTCMASSQ
ncbi:putative araC-type DNA-binding domain-containing protein, partial [Vibrio parahaemolyticus V-223/04]